jgi:hypothetical protein
VKKSTVVTAIVVAIVGSLSCAGGVTDYTDSDVFAPLIGLCLKTKHDMVATPMGADAVSLIPTIQVIFLDVTIERIA